ncbi:endonuclease I family protein [Metabacillus herbersteinensis]|uniref:Endonuclease I family protein n=1 Tax=Metabacillus herbersteinensis TaxID=283816 RepID=A0ABV6GFW9_9BACI
MNTIKLRNLSSLGLEELLQECRSTRIQVKTDSKAYYDVDKDYPIIKEYYADIEHNGRTISKEKLHQLLESSHQHTLAYDPSRYLYPWVDLQSDGNLKSLYSGKQRNPEAVIAEDFKLQQLSKPNEDVLYNCEHVVPQSWFNKAQPMKGDLHHLFTCERDCNQRRSNYPYHDFEDYEPVISVSDILKHCGKYEESKFEPEYGKGIVARAMMYFLVRYPNRLQEPNAARIDLELLIKWHEDYPVSTYEKHRNLAIYELQGNRNPFIDYPDWVYKAFI